MNSRGAVMDQLFTVSLLSLSAIASSFPKDLQPIHTVGPKDSWLFPSFQGAVWDNDTQRLGLDFQRMITINHMLYIAARDYVFAVNLSASFNQIIPHQKLMWKSEDLLKCIVKGKNTDECYNYIKVLVLRNDETLFACGTNAFNPTCRNYRLSSLKQVGAELVGQARCPFESHQTNVGIFAGGHFYSATVSDFQASDAVIYRSLGGEGSLVLRSIKYDSKWLREPRFIHAMEYGSHVYFFFSEIAVEYTVAGKVLYSRVARVCKNDNGGSARVLERHWTSFLKARLNCSVPGDSFFYFDVLQSVSSIIQIHQRPAVVGVFTTQTNSIPGSAVCGFYMDEIEQAFLGRFKEQKGTDSAWSAVPKDQVPTPRPGSCSGDSSASGFLSSVLFPDSMLSFIKAHPLMDECVSSINNQPLLTLTTGRYKLSHIAVDTVAGPYRNHTVVFLGSDDGHVLKVLMNLNPNSSYSATLLEDIHVYNPSKCEGTRKLLGLERRVLGLELDKENHALFVAFSSCIIRVPLSHCTKKNRNCRSRCLSSRDPYCVWLQTGHCVDVSPGLQPGFEQDVNGDEVQIPDTCNINISRGNHTFETDSLFGVPVVSVDEESGGTSKYMLLIAFVLMAFVCGVFLSMLMFSCYCGQYGQHVVTSEPQPKLGLTNLSNFLEPQALRASEQIYCSVLSKYNHHTGPFQQQSYLPNPEDIAELTSKYTNTLNSRLEQNPTSKDLEGKESTHQVSASIQGLSDYKTSLSLSHKLTGSVSITQSPADGHGSGPVLALHEFLNHVDQEVGVASEGDRIAAVTPELLSGASGRAHCVVLVGTSYYSSSTLPQDHELPADQGELLLHPELETKRESDRPTRGERDEAMKKKLEGPVLHPLQCISLIKLRSAAAVSRQHSFNQQGALQHRLDNMSPSSDVSATIHRQHCFEIERSYRSDRFEHNDRSDRIDHSDGSDRTDHSDGSDRTDHSDGSDRFDHSDRSDRINHSDRSDKFDHSDRSERTDRSYRAYRFDHRDRANRTDHRDRADRLDHSDRADRTDHSDRADRTDHRDRADRSDHSFSADRTDHRDRVDRSDHSFSADRFDHRDRADRTDHSSKGADEFVCYDSARFNDTNRSDVCDYRPLLPGGSCLTRQHSYSEQPHTSYHHSAAIIRRTASFKPHTSCD
ncbi:semaphorin-6C-like [Hoplias malabaricus]|uniref:semaphorin-6C-like n=1 Tax=Hoplias malabaricus TaxID=27720 RepID=UPI003462B272